MSINSHERTNKYKVVKDQEWNMENLTIDDILLGWDTGVRPAPEDVPADCGTPGSGASSHVTNDTEENSSEG